MENATAAGSSQSNISRIYIWKDKQKSRQQWQITIVDNNQSKKDKTTNMKRRKSNQTTKNKDPK